MNPARRARIEKEIERHLDAAARLVALLDALDGDADGEPDLGWVETEWGIVLLNADDCEEEVTFRVLQGHGCGTALVELIR
ncbi:MAG: hypothetical protein H6874_10380 [Hyphomicrobiaceae bacterium]|nr:hypothetical protein [Hyphomicrobiaceae bacterium]